MEDEQVAVSITELKKEVGSLKHRVDDLEGIVNAVHSLAVEMARQTEEIKHMNKNMQRLNADVDELKGKPANRWEDAVKTFVGALVGAAAAIFFK